MTKDLFWISFKYYLRRASRDPFGLLVFVVLPVVLVYILSFVYTRNPDEQIYVAGYNMISTHIAVGMMLLFQLNGGIYLLSFLNNDLLKPMKWRLKATPCHAHTFVFAGTAACLLFTVFQGLMVVAATALFSGAYWGSLWMTVLVIVIISMISQLLNMVLLMLIRNISTAEYLSWFIAWCMAALGGLMFPLPDNAFFRFMSQYGTPFALARSAIMESGFLGTSYLTMWICVLVLLLITLILAALVIVLGRRKLV